MPSMYNKTREYEITNMYNLGGSLIINGYRRSLYKEKRYSLWEYLFGR